MRKIVLMTSVSLDGFFEGPNREISWHRVDDELHEHFNDVLAPMGGFLNGRVMYQLMAEFWPTADADPAATAPIAEYARIWRDMPKIVYSRTLGRADWNARVVRDVVPAEVLALKAEPGGDLVVSGADLASAFVRHDLIDEYRIYVHPVLLGEGNPLFRSSDAPVDLQLLETRRFGSGVVLLHYGRADRVGPDGGGPGR
jgi:dihydrofolate reductase